jgi:hypothetical protein
MCRVAQQQLATPGSVNLQLDASMLDLIYVLGTIAFFVLMLLYVRACERLGRDTTDHTEHTP